uniref:Helitron_like_N domain-containing protein n=1 Tax=Globodera pallida TaxID=36090 RepID=A0A183C1B5_GLOPA
MVESAPIVPHNTLDFVFCANNSLSLPMMGHHERYAEQRDKCPIPHCTNTWNGIKDVDYMPTCGNLTQQTARVLPIERGRFGGRSKRQGASELCTCPYCQALLLPSEAIGDSAFSKCCAKGRVCLRDRFDNLQQRPANIMALFTNRDTLTIRRHSDLVQRSMAYNDSLAFGCIRIQRTRNFANSFRIVKCNNMIRYVLWDFNPPTADLPQLHGQLFTIPPADARLRIDQIAEDQLLDPELLHYLHEVLRDNHPFANVYQIAAETYRQLEPHDKLNFWMLVVDTNTKGDEHTVEETGQQQPDEHLADPRERQIMEIQPGRINVETVAGSKLVAQVQNFNTPPKF